MVKGYAWRSKVLKAISATRVGGVRSALGTYALSSLSID